jgi:hypothetical protein
MRTKLMCGHLAQSCQRESIPHFALRNRPPSTGQASRCREMPRTVAGRSRKGCGYFPSFPLRLTRETC